ncbi:MAG: protease modulator HflC [Pseudomonadota bacterium]
MKPFGIVGIIVAILAVVALLNSFFIVDQRRQVVLLQVGAAQAAFNEPGEDEAGLKFKIPFIQSTINYDRRNLGLDVDQIEVFASNQEQLIVDAFVRWQIAEPITFYSRLTTQDEAQRQLTRFADTAIRNALGTRLPEDIVSGQRSELMDEIRDSLAAAIAGRGIQIIDVRLKRVDLPQDVSVQVFTRMEATRNQEAEQIRAEGDERAQLVRAEAERERTVLLAEARREAEQIRGEGDASRNEIYAEAYDRDAEFFRFQRALIACEKAFGVGDLGDSADTESSGPRSQQEPTRIIVAPNQLGLCDEFIVQAQANGRPRR